MLAGQIAAYACLGCVPLEETPQAFAGLNSANSSVHIVESQYLTAQRDRFGAAPGGQFSGFSAVNWAMNDTLAELKAKSDAAPTAIRFEDNQTLQARWSFTASSDDTGLGLDMMVQPRATIEKRGDVKTARAGAEVRLGQNLVEAFDQRGKASRVSSWYMFAGADGEALCWDVGDKGTTIEGVALRDQVTVGDLQAGVAFHRAGGELSIGYVRREVKFQDLKTSDDFAAISFTMRR